MIIYLALLKYGYSNFRLEIIEYCAPDKAIEREQYYLELLKPDYNLLKYADSSFGYKHTKDTIAKFKARSLTTEQKAKLLAHLKIHNSSKEKKEQSRENILKYNWSKRKRVEVLDTFNNETTVYASISEAALAIECSPPTISRALKSPKEGRLIKKRFAVKYINDE
jgi:group I intron endonuclease